MPVSIHRIEHLDAESQPALMRILKDLPADHALSTRFQEWQNSPQSYQSWFAKFNDRFAAAALVQNNKIKALVVHPATRRRGVARRLVHLMVAELPELQVDALESEEAKWLHSIINELSN